MIATLPSFSANAAPLWPKHLSHQPGHPICWPACWRAGCLQRAYPSHATEQDGATTELTVAGGPRVRIRLAPAVSHVRTTGSGATFGVGCVARRDAKPWQPLGAGDVQWRPATDQPQRADRYAQPGVAGGL